MGFHPMLDYPHHYIKSLLTIHYKIVGSPIFGGKLLWKRRNPARFRDVVQRIKMLNDMISKG